MLTTASRLLDSAIAIGDVRFKSLGPMSRRMSYDDGTCVANIRLPDVRLMVQALAALLYPIQDVVPDTSGLHDFVCRQEPQGPFQAVRRKRSKYGNVSVRSAASPRH